MAAISNNQIAEAIYETLRGKTREEETILSKDIVRFLARKGLLSKSKDILSHLNKIINLAKGKVEARVISAEKLTESTKAELVRTLSKKYSSKEVHLIELVDDKVLGGLRIEINDEVMDLTIKRKIHKLQEHLIGKK